LIPNIWLLDTGLTIGELHEFMARAQTVAGYPHVFFPADIVNDGVNDGDDV